MFRHIANQTAHIIKASLSAVGSHQLLRISFSGLFLNHQISRQLVGLHFHKLHGRPPFFLLLARFASFAQIGTVFVTMGFLEQKEETIQIMVRPFVSQGNTP